MRTMGRNGLMKLICNTKMRTCWQQDKEVIFLYFILIVYLVILNTNNKHFLIPNANICHNLHQFYDLYIFSWVLLLMGVRGWTVLEKFNLIQTRGYSRKYAHVRYNEKWQKSSRKGHNYNFFPLDFANLGHLVYAHVVFTENK